MSKPAAPKIRLFVDGALSLGASVAASEAQAHYLLHVMRRASSDPVALFNGRDGEWRAKVQMPSKKHVVFEVEEQLRPQSPSPDLWLAFAPVKRIDAVVEKASELGAAALLPVMTRRTDVSRINFDRMRAIAIEAAEQCERLSIPVIQPAQDFDSFLRGWPAARRLYFLDETGQGAPIARALQEEVTQSCAFLVGPEGGFTESELDALRQVPSAKGVSLGPRILRAETAALAALACWQALRGDWAGLAEG
ncbi:MAG: 16S rRNA (uracil(1498)-N(3))-methyltransferase [Rhodospirillaceae bacterium]